jgi:hypothetical protein
MDEIRITNLEGLQDAACECYENREVTVPAAARWDSLAHRLFNRAVVRLAILARQKREGPSTCDGSGFRRLWHSNWIPALGSTFGTKIKAYRVEK